MQLNTTKEQRYIEQKKINEQQWLETSDRLCLTVSEHFLCNNHNATDMQLIPLELVQPNRDRVDLSVRKASVAYLIERGETLEPHGLNKKVET